MKGMTIAAAKRAAKIVVTGMMTTAETSMAGQGMAAMTAATMGTTMTTAGLAAEARAMAAPGTEAERMT